MRKFNFNIKDRKILYIILCIAIGAVFTLTIAYAALNAVLNISGNAEVAASNWDVHLANVQLNSSSATTTAPTITDPKTATFSTTLTKPGDFYEFTIDVVNNGSIDAMIDSVTKTPELSATQKKYLNYIVEYQNGEAITTKQLVLKNSFVRLKVKLEYRNDITTSDLPSTSETLSLSFTVNYTQADETGTNVTDNGIWTPYKVISGDLETVGSEVAIGDEHFYIISSDEDSVTMLAKYNLHVGNSVDESYTVTPLENPTGIQNSSAIGVFPGFTDDNPAIGTTAFSSTYYWSSTVTAYPAYVYDSNSTLYNYVENYRTYLESHGVEIEEARLIKMEELESLGCSRSSNSCKSAPSWVYATTYWSGVAHNYAFLWHVDSNGTIYPDPSEDDCYRGVRPVITLAI